MKVNWTDFKTFFTTRKLSPQYVAVNSTMYLLKAFDGPFHLECHLYQTTDPTGFLDWESNYKATSNTVLIWRDAYGGEIAPREKVTIQGWHFQIHGIDFTTSTVDGYFNKSLNPVTLELADLGYVTYKLYKIDGTEITTQLEADLYTRFTVIDWCVDYEMELRGAAYRHATAPTQDIYLFCAAAPGIVNAPFAQGGINLKHLGNGSGIDSDGRAAKYMHPTSPIPGLNKFRMTLYHPAGVKHNGSFFFQLYKP